jgi:Helix-turn-helix domain
MPKLTLDSHVLDGLMADLVGHDRRPSAFILYLALTRLCARSGTAAKSLQDLATASGLSKTAVQRAVGHLTQRKLLQATRMGAVDIPRYRVLRPWVR